MIDKPFYKENNDKGLSIILKREANIVLASLKKDDPEYTFKYYHFKETLDVVKAIERTDPQCDEDINFILNTLNTLWTKGILSPLTLKDDEFSSFDINGLAHNLRFYNIYKIEEVDSNNNPYIYNREAYKAVIRKQYDGDLMKQVPVDKHEVKCSPTIYINKGGRITGDYIDACRIRPELVNKNCYTIQSTVGIPSSAVYTKEFGMIYTADHREPNIKILKDFYEVSEGFSSKIDDAKIDIRKFQKL